MNYGPDNNLPLDEEIEMELTIPVNASVSFSFASNADWENAICIYENGNKIIEKGNQNGRSMSPETIAKNAQEQTLVLTGWHKNGPANPDLPWVQSAYKFTGNADGSMNIGYSDTGNPGFQDMVITVQFI